MTENRKKRKQLKGKVVSNKMEKTVRVRVDTPVRHPVYKKVVNKKKVYVVDNGLINSVSFKFSEDKGKLLENLVFIELKRRLKEIYYWKGKGEVDFVIKNTDNSLDLINVCYNNEIPEREINSINEFIEKHNESKINNKIIITKDLEKEYKIDGKIIRYIPLWKWLLE
jgi:predicted AAA+ superfamily ATPase